VALADLAEEALRINAGSLLQHDVELVRDFQIRPTISTDRYKIIQILIKSPGQPIHACDESGRRDKRITIRIAADARRVHIAVSDNGVGIPVENLVRIFNYGFNDKKGRAWLRPALQRPRREGAWRLAHCPQRRSGLGATFTLELPTQSSPPFMKTPPTEKISASSVVDGQNESPVRSAVAGIGEATQLG